MKKQKPDLKIIFTSGYSPELLGNDLALDHTVFLPKPHRPPQLAQLVRQCLDTKKPNGEAVAA